MSQLGFPPGFFTPKNEVDYQLVGAKKAQW